MWEKASQNIGLYDLPDELLEPTPENNMSSKQAVPPPSQQSSGVHSTGPSTSNGPAMSIDQMPMPPSSRYMNGPGPTMSPAQNLSSSLDPGYGPSQSNFQASSGPSSSYSGNFSASAPSQQPQYSSYIPSSGAPSSGNSVLEDLLMNRTPSAGPATPQPGTPLQSGSQAQHLINSPRQYQANMSPAGVNMRSPPSAQMGIMSPPNVQISSRGIPPTNDAVAGMAHPYGGQPPMVNNAGAPPVNWRPPMRGAPMNGPSGTMPPGPQMMPNPRMGIRGGIPPQMAQGQLPPFMQNQPPQQGAMRMVRIEMQIKKLLNTPICGEIL